MRTDSEVKRDVEDELKYDASVDSSDIGVSAKNGVVAPAVKAPLIASAICEIVRACPDTLLGKRDRLLALYDDIVVAERAAVVPTEPELPMPGLAAAATQPLAARINVRPRADPETERLRALLTETLHELEALRALLA